MSGISGPGGGRPRHEIWKQDFLLQKDKVTKKPTAYCNICQKTLMNTAAARLASHRKKCNHRVIANVEVEEEEPVELSPGSIRSRSPRPSRLSSIHHYSDSVYQRPRNCGKLK